MPLIDNRPHTGLHAAKPKTVRLPWGLGHLARKLLMLLGLFSLLAGPLASGLTVSASQATNPQQQARALLESLTPEERVGQLFLVTFQGNEVTPDSAVYDLITNHHVGGVILRSENDNFAGGDQALNLIQNLNRQIQQASWDSSQTDQQDLSGESFRPAFIPLFIGISQEGDGYPYDQILTGLTSLPNQMALGATWNPDLANQVGTVLGREISALGFNMLLGPSLDVLENPYMEGANDLGTRTFGGDPFWVGKMGSSFVQGVHQGSNGQVAVVAKHFPGSGGSDRLPEEEIATVRKTLDQLKTLDMIPFFAVTGDHTSPTTTDALLTSHTRYQIQSIRDTTRPVSLDPGAFNQLMALVENWRNNGGVMVSDNLGSQAMRSYFNLTNPGQIFDPSRVTLNAFYAGNDLLYVADFSSGELDSYTSALRTLEFFARKYRDDPTFAQSVNISVQRILALKYHLYEDFSLENIQPVADRLVGLGDSSQVTFEVAQQAATLISPSQAELDVEIPDPPNMNDRIVFLTDTRTARQCSQCPLQPLLDVRALEQVVLRRYGPLAEGRISQNYLTSYSLQELQDVLAAGHGDTDLERDLKRANWIVFSMLDNSQEFPSYQTLSRFLSERPDLFQHKRQIVFAFNAPYFLDATNITKLTAYYGLYSKAPQFLEVAAYLLFRDFRELRPSGALPVSVPGIAYDLYKALLPDPNRVIPLQLDIAQLENSNIPTTPEPAPVPEFRVGDVIPVRTGIILDHNGKPVPDSTPVEFRLIIGGEVRFSNKVETTNGIARTTFTVHSPGPLEIRAESELARSEPLLFDIPLPNGESISPTPTEEPTPTPSPTPTPTVTPLPGGITEAPPPTRPQFADWVMAVFMAAGIAWSAYRLLVLVGQVQWGVRGGFLALIGGLLAYSYLAMELPGSENLMTISVSRGVFLVTLLGAALGLLIAWSWRSISSQLNNQ